jgi:hypothetical protein
MKNYTVKYNYARGIWNNLSKEHVTPKCTLEQALLKARELSREGYEARVYEGRRRIEVFYAC